MKTGKLLLGLLLPLMLCAPARGAVDAESAEIIALEIRNLSTSVDRLTGLLYQQAQQKGQEELLRKLDIAVSYLNFRSRRIETLERDLANTQSGRSRLEDIVRQLGQRLEELDDQAGNSPTQQPAIEQARLDTSEQLKMLRSRLSRTEAEIVDYENRLQELRTQLDSVERFVERNLSL